MAEIILIRTLFGFQNNRLDMFPLSLNQYPSDCVRLALQKVLIFLRAVELLRIGNTNWYYKPRHASMFKLNFFSALPGAFFINRCHRMVSLDNFLLDNGLFISDYHQLFFSTSGLDA